MLDHTCRITVRDHAAEIKAAEGLREIRGVRISGVHVFENEAQERCVCIFCRDSAGWDEFASYRFMQDEISIGSAKQDRIRINDARMPASGIVIDRQKRIITDRAGCGLLSVDGQVCREAVLAEGSDVRILNLRVLPVKDMFLINRPENIAAEGEQIKPEGGKTFQSISCGSENHTGGTDLNERVFQEELAAPESTTSVRRIPLILTIGPSLTMAAASGAGSFFSVQNALMNGRDLMDLMPMILMPAGMIAGALIWMPASRIYENHAGKRGRKLRISSYREYLADMKERILSQQKAYRKQTEILFPENPCERAMWLSSPAKQEYLCFACGYGSEQWEIRLNAAFRLSESDPLFPMIAGLKETACIQEDVLLVRSLKNYETVYLLKSEKAEDFMIRMMTMLLWNHSPECVSAGILCSPGWEQEHFWIRFLPHLRGSGGRRIFHSPKDMISGSAADEKEMIWFITDEKMRAMIPSGDHHTVMLCEKKPLLKKNELLIESDSHSGKMSSITETVHFAYSPHYVNPWSAAYRMHMAADPETFMHQSTGFFRLMGFSSAEEPDIRGNWKVNHTADHIRTAIGTDSRGDRIILDLHENGMGPHGLIAGMTGSGKSELILTILLGLAVRYSPSDLQYVLIDFKGGGVVQALSCGGTYIPHLSAVLTNLNDNVLQRALVSFSNECRRRETLLNRASQIYGRPVANTDTYQRLWNSGSGLPYLPHLVILVDEFAELKKTCPEFLKELMSLARIGRSLGLHLILATQKPGGVVDEQTGSNARFRICLKVRDPQDSAEMLHCRDAADLHQPGEFILQYDSVVLKGRGGYASGPFQRKHAGFGITDSAGRTVYEDAPEAEGSLNEAAAAVRMLVQASAGMDYAVQKIWPDELEELRAADAERFPAGTIGILDDFDNGVQPPLMFSGSYPGTAVIAAQKAVRQEFARSLLYLMLRMRRKEDEYCLLDDTGMNEAWIRECPGMIGSGSLADDELIRNLYRHLRNRKDNGGVCYVLITDYASLQGLEESARIMIRRMMEHAEQLRICFVLMAGNTQMFPYRDLSLFSQRIALKSDGSADLSAFFEMSTKLTCPADGFGLIRKDRILQFSWFRIFEEDMMRLIRKMPADLKSDYRLPVMPECISLKDCHAGIPAGFSRETYEMRMLDGPLLIVIATYEEELDELYEVYRKYPQWNTLRNPDEKICMCAQESGRQILMFSLENYLSSCLSSRKNAWPVLYIGEGFHDQYHFTVRKKVRIEAGQGILMYGGKSEVIQLAEE